MYFNNPPHGQWVGRISDAMWDKHSQQGTNSKSMARCMTRPMRRRRQWATETKVAVRVRRKRGRQRSALKRRRKNRNPCSFRKPSTTRFSTYPGRSVTRPATSMKLGPRITSVANGLLGVLRAIHTRFASCGRRWRAAGANRAIAYAHVEVTTRETLELRERRRDPRPVHQRRGCLLRGRLASGEQRRATTAASRFGNSEGARFSARRGKRYRRAHGRHSRWHLQRLAAASRRTCSAMCTAT